MFSIIFIDWKKGYLYTKSNVINVFRNNKEENQYIGITKQIYFTQIMEIQ